ncbi:MAG TPA: VanZ family protein, partial [Bacteroidia bacterium]|nr:VanZ family protein [Bacteroidia bacterium]
MKWALLWALLIFILCAIPGHDIPHISFLELLSFDKFVHAGMFFVQSLLLTRALVLLYPYPTLQTKFLWISFFFCASYGGILELMQGAFFIERTASIYDFMANSFGAAMACLFYRAIEEKVLRRFLK